ncbi:YhgE/Pip family protein [Bifidobacterium sp.]|uniref:YhgE/Pip family protein n=1 Tax=Bifidobacterium sp. TaxID=41200 RepID=UPI0039E9F915
MLKAEWKSLLSNKFMIVVLVALALVPGLYQLIFLNSMWDVYGRVSDLPVAVVNNDKAVDFSGKSLHLGTTVSDGLKKTKSMDYHFVNARQASAGIKDGSYYLVLTFPSNFSRNATSLLTSKPKTLQLRYQTSQGRSYTASKLSASAVNALKDKVSKQITQLYVTQILQRFATTGSALGTASNGAVTLQTGSAKIASGSSLIAQNLVKLSDGALQFSDGTQQLSVGAKQYVDAVTKVNAGAQKLDSGASKLASAGGSLSQGTTKLAAGANSLSEGTDAYASGVNAIATGAQKLAASGRKLSQGAGQLSGSAASGAATLNSGAEGLTSAVSSLDAALAQTSQQQSDIAALASALPSTNSAVSDLNKAVQQLPDDTSMTTLEKSNASDLEQLRNVSGQIERLQGDASSQTGSDAENSALLRSLVAELQTVTDSMAENQTEMTKLEQSSQSVAALKQRSQAVADTSQKVLPSAATALNGAESGLQSARSALDAKIVPGSVALQSGVKSYTEGVDGGIAQLGTGVESYVSGVDRLNAGAQKLSQNSGTLALGAEGLAGGLNALNSKVPQLTGGLASLQSGTSTLAGGLQTLSSKGSTLTAATSKLDAASTTIAEGSGKLAAAQGKVSSGAGKVSSGLGTLSGKLAKGSTAISKVNAKSDAAKAVSAPVSAKRTDHDSVANNGTGMAPYMISVALYVGTLAINMMYDATLAKKKPSSGIAWWASKMSVLGLVAVVQAFLVDFVVVRMLGLQPLNHLQFLGVLLLISAMNMSFVTFFNVLLGKVGAFLMMIFLMVQLGASAGTYPIELSGGFYQAIHPWIPMTYAIDALRESISIGGSLSMPVLVLSLILVACNVLMILVFARRKGMSSVGFERQQELNSSDGSRRGRNGERGPSRKGAVPTPSVAPADA